MSSRAPRRGVPMPTGGPSSTAGEAAERRLRTWRPGPTLTVRTAFRPPDGRPPGRWRVAGVRHGHLGWTSQVWSCAAVELNECPAARPPWEARRSRLVPSGRLAMLALERDEADRWRSCGFEGCEDADRRLTGGASNLDGRKTDRLFGMQCRSLWRLPVRLAPVCCLSCGGCDALTEAQTRVSPLSGGRDAGRPSSC